VPQHSGHPLTLYNTATRRVEPFIPIEPGKAGIYACGPTVYHYAHIGNMRTYVFEDVLRRVLDRAGYAVHHVMNITDVGHLQSDADDGDDKMALAAAREKKSPWDIAKYYEDAFFRHADALNIHRPHTVCRATDHIAEMIAMVETLIEKGHAYEAGGNVYFDVSTFDRYTAFAGLNLEDQVQTDRVDADSRKRGPADFVLWFSQSKYPNQIMKWDSPWGMGFPGWHIECSAMATKYLGKRFDIHCGGIDHIRVHHTNEIAQSECAHESASGTPWVNVWMHGAFLTVDKGKMSKSKGETLTIDTLIENGFDPLDYRALTLTAHYRSELMFSFDALAAASEARKGLRERMRDWKREAGDAVPQTLSPDAQAAQSAFWTAAFDDLHMPRAMASLWSVVKDSRLSASEKRALLVDFDTVLGIGLDSGEETLDADLQALIDARQKAREGKNWAESDRLRDVLLEKGITVKDTASGPVWGRTR